MMEKIFTPYFTTKGTATGTGIGLYMAKMIVEKEMKGMIHVENRYTGVMFQDLPFLWPLVKTPRRTANRIMINFSHSKVPVVLVDDEPSELEAYGFFCSVPWVSIRWFRSRDSRRLPGVMADLGGCVPFS